MSKYQSIEWTSLQHATPGDSDLRNVEGSDGLLTVLCRKNFFESITCVLQNTRHFQHAAIITAAQYACDIMITRGTVPRCILTFFIELGCNFNARDPHGATRVMRAAKHGASSFLEAFIQEGSRLDFKDDCGRTVLHQAVIGEPLAMRQKGSDVLISS